MNRWWRDPDQRATYAAEEDALAQTAYNGKLLDAEMALLADRLFATEWWQRNVGSIPSVELALPGDKTSYADADRLKPHRSPVIRFVPWQMSPRTLAHEAAHIAQFHLFCPERTNRNVVQDHGPEFRATMIVVSEIMLGAEATKQLIANYYAHERVRKYVLPSRSFTDVWVPRQDRLYDPERLGIFPSWRMGVPLTNQCWEFPPYDQDGDQFVIPKTLIGLELK